jgi:threonine/homoserine/homoserine lactone efflux protein
VVAHDPGVTSTGLLTFVVASVVLIALPGPSVLFAIGRALSVGRARALAAVVGNALGVWLQVLVVAVGLGELISRSAVVFASVKFAGAIYLVYLGVSAIRHRGAAWAALDGGRPARGGLRSLADGVVVGATNPKTVVFFVAFLPQFVDPTHGVALQIAGLGALFAALAVALDTVWVVLAGGARTWFARSPRRLAAIGGTGGVAMIGLGVGLAVSGRPD